MGSESLEVALKAFDKVSGAQTVAINKQREVSFGRLPEGITTADLEMTETTSWQQIGGQYALVNRLRGHAERGGWIVAFFQGIHEGEFDDLATLLRSVCLAGSEKERVLEELAEMRLMFQSVLDTIPVRVFWKDLSSAYLGCNRLFAEDAGLSKPDDLIGKTDFDLNWHEQAELYRGDDHQVMSTGEAKVDYEEPQTSPDGEQIWLQTSKIPLRNVNFETVGVLGTYADITPRKRAEADREELLVTLEGKNAELERFTYTASHDLKSPLVTIRCWLGVLEKDLRNVFSLRPEDRERIFNSFRRIDNASLKMFQLLEDLLEMSRVGRILRPRKETDLRVLVDDAVLLCSGALDAAEADLKIEGEFPIVEVDGPRIVQVLQNLVDNACKYRHVEKPMALRICGKRDGSLSIEDNGIGIPERHQERVFEIFEKLDPETEGCGIGLALVKRIVETHGGTIGVQSLGEDGGTAFHLNLPLAG